MVDAPLNLAAIRFELGFAWASGADAAAELRHSFALAGEARKHVLELGKLDLELALACAGVTGKYVEDELRAVKDTARQRCLKVAQLGGCKVVVKENQIGIA